MGRNCTSLLLAISLTNVFASGFVIALPPIQQTDDEKTEFIEKLQKDFESNNQVARDKAILAILSTRDSRLIPQILELLESPNSSHRKNAVLALYHLNAKSAAQEIRLLLDDEESDVRHVAAEYGSYLGMEVDFKLVKRFLDDEDFTSQSAAMHLTRALNEDQAMQVLGNFLKHESHHLRKRAIPRLLQYEPELISEYAIDIALLAGDNDRWVRRTVSDAEKKLVKLISSAELEELADHQSKHVRLLAYRMLEKQGKDVSDAMRGDLRSNDPEIRLAAFKSLARKKTIKSKEILDFLNDEDPGVRLEAIRATGNVPSQEYVPMLRKLFAKPHSRYERERVAISLAEMNETVWESNKSNYDRTRFFALIEDLQENDGKGWSKLADASSEVIDKLSKLKDLPCDTSQWGNIKTMRRFREIEDAVGKIDGRRCKKTTFPISMSKSLVAVDSNLTVKGQIRNSIVFVNGDLYQVDGVIYDSILFVRGDIIIDSGYIRNSLVICGRQGKLSVDGGYINQSLVAANEIESDGYLSDAFYSGQSLSTDLRNTRKLDAESVYGIFKDFAKTDND